MYKKTIAYTCNSNDHVLIKLLVTLKITVLFLLLVITQAGAEVYAQKASIRAEKLTLKEVFANLRKQTGYHFLYLEKDISDVPPVTLYMDNASLSTILDQCLKGQSLHYVIRKNRVLIERITDQTQLNDTVSQNQFVLKGKVENEDKEPLPGTSIRVKGTNRGTTADIDGNFILEVNNPKEVLQISYMGYFPLEIVVGSQKNQTFTLAKDSKQEKLDEVVVVGFGTQKKVSLTGAISTVSVKELEQQSQPSIANALAGRLPGIITRQTSGEPGYDQAQVFIRGLSTWVNRSPLVLVDGVERDMNLINAQEIESFSVLKDASATAVYGVRGANGVILITTKKGTVGRPTVTLRSENAINTSLRMPEYIDGGEYSTLWNEAYRNMGQPEHFTEEELRKYKDGSDPYLYPNVDWTDEIMRKHTWQSINNLSINGGNNIIRYYTNAGYTEQNGIWKTDDTNEYNTNINLKRYNLRANIDVNVTDNLVFEMGIGGIIQQGNYPVAGAPSIFENLRRISPIAFPKQNPDGSPGGNGWYVGSNPWATITQSGFSVLSRNTVQGTFAAKWDLSKVVTQGLSLNGRFAYDHWYQSQVSRRKDFEVKQYTGVDPATGEDRYTVHREATPLGYSPSNSANRAYYAEFIANYDRTFDKHHVSGMMMYNQRDYVDLTAGDPINNLPFRRLGVASRFTYGYADRYLVEFNAGYNGSENFPKGQRFGFFPSVSAGWILSNESFWGVKNVVNNLKIRGSYGQVGNDQIGQRFLFLTRMNTTSAQSYSFGEAMISKPGIDEAYIGLKDVTWEVSTKSNIGLDAELFNGVISLQVDAFREKRDGILIQRGTIPTVTGFYPWVVPYGNLGKAKNKGIDGQLEIKQARDNGFYYSFRGNFTYSKNEIVENDEATQRYPWLSAKGHPIDQPFGYTALGIFQSWEEINDSPEQKLGRAPQPGDIKYKDLNGDNVIDDNDRMAIGLSRTPQIMFGFGGTVAWKGFDASVFFTGAAKTSVFLEGATMYPFQQGVGSYNVQRLYYDNRWTPETPDGKYPGVITVDNPNNTVRSTLWMVDGSYLRLKNMELGYTLSQEKVGRFGMKSVRFFVNGINLYTWDKVKIMDPEQDNGSGFYPMQRTLNLGLQVNFK
ncbi:TonB-dependent receptor [Olivibacter ginsenosidimutans]|uniref:TonB-dependent receptor n=1 Tax=Olivibacter ginsenosidimutans TaxID=1176537 RepID=A0ABP9AGY3_9SPHI